MYSLSRIIASVLTLSGLVSSELIHSYQPYQIVGVDPDYNRDVPQLITSKGCPAEVHTVQTEDGFLLGVQRIASGRGQTGVNPTPVIVMHGLLDSSAAWVLNSETESLAYILADSGQDVWLVNSRGNYYSRNHIKYTTADAAFWAFSFDEMAKYDVPALVDYVLDYTNTTSVSWVGHSQGTCQVFAALASQPALNDKINLFVALAPVTYVGHQTSFLIGAMAAFKIDELFAMFGFHEFLPSTTFIHDIGALFCGPFPELCEDFIFLLCGPDSEPMHNLNATRMVDYISHTPAGTSVQNMIHWANNVRSGGYTMFDYGSAAANMAHYNSTTVPVYDISKITTKMALFTGTNDDLADPKDVAYMLSLLNPKSVIFQNNQLDYEHLDFTWGMDDHVKIYPQIVSLVQQHNKPTLNVPAVTVVVATS